MRILVVQNYAKTTLGQLAGVLDEAGAKVDLWRADEGRALPAKAGEHDALIVLGGAQNALADDAYPYFPTLLELMQDFAERDKAVLGICLGCQLLARAFGGRNEIGTAPEFGWRDVKLAPGASDDPLFSAMPATLPVFQWHDDTFTLPAGATLLAESPAAPNQAFRVGRAAYGIQFHFEADRGVVRRWSHDFADYLAKRHPDWPRRFQEEEGTRGAAADAAGITLARAWVALV